MKKTTLHKITGAQFNHFAQDNEVTTFLDEDGLMSYIKPAIHGVTVSMIRNHNDNSYLLSVPRCRNSNKVRKTLGVA